MGFKANEFQKLKVMKANGKYKNFHTHGNYFNSLYVSHSLCRSMKKVMTTRKRDVCTSLNSSIQKGQIIALYFESLMLKAHGRDKIYMGHITYVDW